MDIEIDPLSSVPIHRQIRDRIVEAIGFGELRRGEQLAPVRVLAAAFAVNPGTVAKAYEALQAEGLLGANAKAGTFVARDRDSGPPSEEFLSGWGDRLTTLIAEARAHGLDDAGVRAACGEAAARVARAA
ncbi:MAG: GntR family transcriptional regulator [Thermoleophilia bacterium]